MRLFGRSRVGERLIALYGGSGEARRAFRRFWDEEYAPLLERGVRPPLVEGFAVWSDREGLDRTLSAAELEQTEAAEAAAVSKAVRKELRPIRWEDIAGEVLIPEWRERAKAGAQAVAGLTVGSAGRAATDPIAVGKRLIPRDTQPYVEAPVLAETGLQTLEHAVAVALIDGGGVVHARLGEPRSIEIGGGRIEPWVGISAVASGEMRVAQWENVCRRLEVAHLPLGGGRR